MEGYEVNEYIEYPHVYTILHRLLSLTVGAGSVWIMKHFWIKRGVLQIKGSHRLASAMYLHEPSVNCIVQV